MALECKTEIVTFRDGSSLTISESNWTIGNKLIRLVREASALPASKDVEETVFRLDVYPRLIAAVVEGEIPDPETLKAWPSDELDKWYTAVQKLNPGWFDKQAPASSPDEDKVKKKEGARVSRNKKVPEDSSA